MGTRELTVEAKELIQEIYSRRGDADIPANAFTKSEFMAETGLKKSVAYNVLMEEVEAGRLLCKKVPGPTGGLRNIFWKPETGGNDDEETD